MSHVKRSFSLFGLCLLMAVTAILAGCEDDMERGKKGENKMDIAISSSAFKDGDHVPVKYTADGQNVSPPLEWTGAPSGTASFALINDDPDAPAGTWVHWVVYDIDSNSTSLSEDITSAELEQMGAKEGATDFGTVGYGGPAPPGGPVHRYFFKLYALDKKLGLGSGASKADVVNAMTGHILAEAQFVGLYQR